MVHALVNNSARNTEGGALACAQMSQRGVPSGFLSRGPSRALCHPQYGLLVGMLLPLQVLLLRSLPLDPLVTPQRHLVYFLEEHLSRSRPVYTPVMKAGGPTGH